ncbi:MAG: YdiU family protein [Gammaproteobacteria bacterium]|nr:YdiU family protein [Gammaproteobacteria bacterium]
MTLSVSLDFDNRFSQQLPADPDLSNQRRQVLGACYSRVKPLAASKPRLVAYSSEMAEQLGLSTIDCASKEFAEIFVGNKQLQGMDPYAMCYGGHQFGHWAGQLGDGRAINLGEVVNTQSQRWALQLKGAGPTPYSRTADGLAVLRSSLREFLCSEAMFHLGVPTTRALSLILTGESVVRDMFYDGNPQPEPGAVVCRVASSFVRFGNFQIFSAQGDIDTLKQLVDFTIINEFPHLGEPSPEVYLKWFDEVCRLTADMIVHWLRVGFVHGVMNTDNMSILGLTIDYGPYGWLENYDPAWTPNTTDANGKRYCYANQPQIGHWNLAQLGNALAPLFNDEKNVEALQQVLNGYPKYFEQGRKKMMAAKLGFEHYIDELDDALVEELLEILAWIETDMTIFYRSLAQIDINVALESIEDEALMSPLLDAYYLPEQITSSYQQRLGKWLRAYIQRLRKDNKTNEMRRQEMDAINPKYVLRNYMAQLAIDKAEEGDFVLTNNFLELLRHPYDEQKEHEQYAAKRPDWARNRAGCSMLSCSS